MPNSIPDRFAGLFRNQGRTTKKMNDIQQQVISIEDEEMTPEEMGSEPIAAKESFELQNFTPKAQKRINRFSNRKIIF